MKVRQTSIDHACSDPEFKEGNGYAGDFPKIGIGVPRVVAPEEAAPIRGAVLRARLAETDPRVRGRHARLVSADDNGKLEAPPGFEPGIEVLQTSALPLGDGAGWNVVL